MQRNPDSFLITFAVGVVSLGVLIWFVNYALGSTAALVVVGGLFGAIMWMGGSVITHATVKATMENLSEFNQADAKIDAGRMAAFKALATGESYEKKANSQIRVMDARRIDQIAQQRAQLLLGDSRNNQDDATGWDVFDDDDSVDSNAFVMLE